MLLSGKKMLPGLKQGAVSSPSDAKGYTRQMEKIFQSAYCYLSGACFVPKGLQKL